jgi:tetratricopeptide (TPR) repeat protein
VFTDKEDFSAARVFYGKSRELFEKLHLKSELSDYYFNLGEIYQFEKEYHSAIECYLKGLKIDSDQSNLISLPGDYNMLGELYLEMNKASEAKDCFRRAISLAGQVGLKEDVAIAQKNLEKLSNKELAASP